MEEIGGAGGLEVTEEDVIVDETDGTLEEDGSGREETVSEVRRDCESRVIGGNTIIVKQASHAVVRGKRRGQKVQKVLMIK